MQRSSGRTSKLAKAISIALALAISFVAAMLSASAQPSGTAADDVVILGDASTQTTIAVIPKSGNIVSEMKVKGHNVLHWPGGGIPFLAPWANRLDETAFYANGMRYPFTMELGNVRAPVPTHGLLQRSSQWEIVETKTTATAAWITSRLEFHRYPALIKQWPFAHTIELTHLLRNGTLEVRTTITNTGAEPMPIAIGFHPYFTLDEAPRDAWTISVGARTRWLLTSTRLPTGETEPIERVFPNPAAAPLKEHDLDDVFGDLVRDAQGRATMSVMGRTQRVDVVFGPNYKAAVIYAPRGQNFICFEPMAGITNALNLAHKGIYKELQTVPPGGTWQESFWVMPKGF